MIKRMRLMGHVRDFIFSFILRPGRKLTPACIAEIENGEIGPDVDPATAREAEAFMSRRLAESAMSGLPAGPLSSFAISEALGWFTRAQGDLYRDETQQVEFKLFLKTEHDALISYAKTMAAFANNSGGYIFYGVNDARKPVGIDPNSFLSADWDRLASICRETFQPDIVWDRDIYAWGDLQLGVVYAFEADQKPVVAAKRAKSVEPGSIYRRYRGHTETIAVGDLFRLLQDRDEKVRRASQQRS